MTPTRPLMFAATLAAGLAACADQPSPTAAPADAELNTAPAHLAYYGYVSGAGQDYYLDGMSSYTNFGYVSTDADPASLYVRDRVNAMSARGQKVVVELGQLLWCPESGYRALCPDWQTRWNTWRANHASVLTSDKVLAFLVRDEPLLWQVNLQDYQLAAREVKARYPWAHIIWSEAVDEVTCAGYPFVCPFEAMDPAVMDAVDWLGVQKFAIHPSSDAGYQTAINRMKAKFPGRSWIYVADGWWNVEAHGVHVGDITEMGSVLREYYALAASDPSAVLLGIFVWERFAEGTSSRDFPLSVLNQHVEVGREITGRTRPAASAPEGRLEGITADGYAVGWACDPDGAWSEVVPLHILADGFVWSYDVADEPSEFFPQCRTGEARRFRTYVGTNVRGRITVNVSDLDGGSREISSTCPDSPGCYPNFSRPIGYLDGVNATGWAWGWTCDPDAPLVSTSVQITADHVLVGQYPTSLGSEPAVNKLCRGGTVHRWGVQLPAWTRGKVIRAYGLDKVAGSALLPVVTCPNGVCRWW